LVAWLLFHGTFSTRLYRAMRKLKFVKDIYVGQEVENMLFRGTG